MNLSIKQQLQAAETVEQARAILRTASGYKRAQPKTVRKWYRIIKERFGVI